MQSEQSPKDSAQWHTDKVALIEMEIYRFIVDNFMFGRADGLRYDESLLQKGVIDSTGVLDLVTFLQDNFEITIEDEEIIPCNLETVKGIGAYVSKKLNQRQILGDLHHAS
jgi:acyl carrier protein